MNYERPKIVIAVIVMVCLNGITGCGTGNSEELQLIQQINISGTITNSQAERLSKVKFLELESLTTITDEQVEILSNVRELWLSGLTSITDAQAESLSKATYLDLNGLTSITDQQAASLSKVYDLEISETLQPLIDKYKKQQ